MANSERQTSFLGSSSRTNSAFKKQASVEEKYLSLIRNLGQGFCIIEILFDLNERPVDYIILEVNDEYAAHSGLPYSVGMTAKQLMPSIEDSWVQRYAHVAITGEPIKFTERKESLGRSFEISAFKIGDANDKKVGIVFSNVTDRIKEQETQTAIKASDSRFQNLVRDATAAIVVLTGAEMTVEIANEAYGKLIDLKPTDFIGKPIFSVIPEAKEYYLPVLQKVAETGEPIILHESPYSGIVNGKTIDGFLHIVTQPYRNSKGEVLGVMQIIQDVTEWVRAKKASEQSEAKFRSLIEEAPIATALFVGRDLRIEVANDAFIGYMGKGRSVIGKRYAEAVPELKGQGFLEKLDEVYTTGCTFEQKGASAFVLVDGRPHQRYFDFIVKALRDSEGNVYALINMAVEVTERVKGEQELRESENRFRMLSEQLEQEVALRTQELLQSNENLQQFAHVASHDLKEPVRKIKTFTSRIQDEFGTRVDGKINVYLEKVQKATDRMMSMIDGVLAYSTINATEMLNEPVDLRDVMRDIESDLEVIIQQKCARIIYDDLPTVEGAKVLLYQLFYNLINNAIKFGRAEQAVAISIKSQSVTEEGKEVARIFVRDNGIGFEQNFAEAIFDTFSRLNPKDQYEGTGLGLALCKKIAERHGGRIHADSVKGQGATFTIELPIKQTV